MKGLICSGTKPKQQQPWFFGSSYSSTMFRHLGIESWPRAHRPRSLYEFWLSTNPVQAPDYEEWERSRVEADEVGVSPEEGKGVGESQWCGGERGVCVSGLGW